MKKKKFLTDKDKADWLNFTKNLGSVENKDRDLKNPYEVTKKIKQLDLHGCSLSEANNKVKNFIMFQKSRCCIEFINKVHLMRKEII